jgi:hypothetical protein
MFYSSPRRSWGSVLVVLGALFVFAGAGYAGHGPLPNHDPACTSSANPAVVGQSFTLSATALPTTDPVWLIVQTPSGNSTVSQVYVNADGSWSGSEVANQAGAWTYTFSGLMNNNKYGAVEACTVQAS